MESKQLLDLCYMIYVKYNGLIKLLHALSCFIRNLSQYYYIPIFICFNIFSGEIVERDKHQK